MDTSHSYSPYSRANTSITPSSFFSTSQAGPGLFDSPSTPTSVHPSLDSSDLSYQPRLHSGAPNNTGRQNPRLASGHDLIPHGDCIIHTTDEHLLRYQNAPYLLLRQQGEHLQRRVLELEIANSVYKKNYEDIVSQLPQLVGMDPDASVVPPPTLPLNKQARIVLGHGWDFPTSLRPEGSNLRFWDMEEWKEERGHSGGGKPGGHDDSVNTAQRYLEHANGEVISGYVANDVRKRMRACIHSLIWSGQATPTEASLGHEARAYIHVLMARGFEFLRYCSNGTWKTDCLLKQVYLSVLKTSKVEGTPKKRKNDSNSNLANKRSKTVPSPSSVSSSTPIPVSQPAPLLAAASNVTRSVLSSSVARTPSPFQQPVVFSPPWCEATMQQAGTSQAGAPLPHSPHPLPATQGLSLPPSMSQHTMQPPLSFPTPALAPPTSPAAALAPPTLPAAALAPSTSPATTLPPPTIQDAVPLQATSQAGAPPPPTSQPTTQSSPTSHTTAALSQHESQPTVSLQPAPGEAMCTPAPACTTADPLATSPAITPPPSPSKAPPLSGPSHPLASNTQPSQGRPKPRAIVPVNAPFIHLRRAPSRRSENDTDPASSAGPQAEPDSGTHNTAPTEAPPASTPPKPVKRRTMKDHDPARLAYQDGVASEQNMYLKRLLDEDPGMTMTFREFKNAFKNLSPDVLEELKVEKRKVQQAKRTAKRA